MNSYRVYNYLNFKAKSYYFSFISLLTIKEEIPTSKYKKRVITG